MSNPLPPISSPKTPAAVREDFKNLRFALDQEVPPKRDPIRNLLIATWNIRKFGDLNEAWTSPSAKGVVKRDWRGLWAITEIISRFDVIAVQEVGGNLKSLRTLMKTLGDDWNFVMTDATRGAAGASERLAFVFDTRRVQLSGLACELVVPPEWLKEVGADALTSQFVRTPYAVSFRTGPHTFVLTTLHVKYGEKAAARIPELKGIARWMADWAKRTTDWEQNFIVLGDFNIDRDGDPLYQAFVSTGLTVAPQLARLPRTLTDKPASGKMNFYDQIAWFVRKNGQVELNMKPTKGGSFNFVPFTYSGTSLTVADKSYRVSDHYPLWMEFEPGISPS